MLHGDNHHLNQNGSRANTTEVVGGKFQDSDAPSGQILLVTDILIAGDEKIELGFSQPDEIAIFEATPATLLGGTALVISEQLMHRPRHTFIQQNPHAGVGASKADSEHSNT
ncbi:MAG: hypothetical protein WCO56_11630 [Verrucomicrobiota bacterium]